MNGALIGIGTLINKKKRILRGALIERRDLNLIITVLVEQAGLST